MNLNVPYAKAALPFLMKYDGMTQTEAESFIQNNDFDAIENRVRIAPYVEEAVRFYGKTLFQNEQGITDLTQEMLGKTDSDSKTASVRSFVLRHITALKSFMAASYAQDATAAVHNRWKTTRGERFFGGTGSQAYHYAPTPLIGLHNQREILKCIHPVSEALSLDIQDGLYEMASHSRAVNYVSDAIDQDGKLAKFIAKQSFNDQQMHADVKAKLSNVSFVEDTLIPQLLEQGFGKDGTVMDKLAEKGIDLHDRPDSLLDWFEQYTSLDR